jgi:hypothetical protein
VKKKDKTVFTKGVPIKITFDGNTKVTLTLVKPAKGQFQVTVHGGVLGTNNAASSGDVRQIVM